MKWLTSHQTREHITKRIKQFFTALVIIYLFIAIIIIIFGNVVYGKTKTIQTMVQKGSGLFL